MSFKSIQNTMKYDKMNFNDEVTVVFNDIGMNQNKMLMKCMLMDM